MNIKLMCGKFENIRQDDIGRIDLVFADPPDNEGRAYDGFEDKTTDHEYVDLLYKWVFKACEITDGPVFFSIAERWMNDMENMIYHADLKLIRRIFWHYTFGQNNKKSYSPCIRPIYWLNSPTIYPKEIYVPSARQIKYGDKRANPEGKMPENLWEFSRVCGTFKERRGWHPTQHPEELIRRIILGHSKPGDTILDPFVGSGTTAIVCQDLGDRNCVGIDQSAYYVSMVNEELRKRREQNKS